jgi:predicted anti-sigma-YlaC factor YlaD
MAAGKRSQQGLIKHLLGEITEGLKVVVLLQSALFGFTREKKQSADPASRQHDRAQKRRSRGK